MALGAVVGVALALLSAVALRYVVGMMSIGKQSKPNCERKPKFQWLRRPTERGGIRRGTFSVGVIGDAAAAVA